MSKKSVKSFRYTCEFFSKVLTAYYLEVTIYILLQKLETVVGLDQIYQPVLFCKSLKSAKYWFYLCWTTLTITLTPLLCDRAVVKPDFQNFFFFWNQFIFQFKLQYIYIQIRIKTVSSDVYSTVDVFLHLNSGCFQVVL